LLKSLEDAVFVKEMVAVLILALNRSEARVRVPDHGERKEKAES
jgi:hypothetical protein